MATSLCNRQPSHSMSGSSGSVIVGILTSIMIIPIRINTIREVKLRNITARISPSLPFETNFNNNLLFLFVICALITYDVVFPMLPLSVDRCNSIVSPYARNVIFSHYIQCSGYYFSISSNTLFFQVIQEQRDFLACSDSLNLVGTSFTIFSRLLPKL